MLAVYARDDGLTYGDMISSHRLSYQSVSRTCKVLKKRSDEMMGRIWMIKEDASTSTKLVVAADEMHPKQKHKVSDIAPSISGRSLM